MYAQVVAVSSPNTLRTRLRPLALAAMLRSQAVKDFIAQKYDGAVIPAA